MIRRHRSTATALVAAALLLGGLVTGCGSDDGDAGGSGALTVYGAASLADVFPAIDPDAEYNFAASDTLATQIREGAPADVYAAANERLPDELLREGLVEQPTVFVTNRLVLIVPRGNPRKIASVADLKAAGITFVMADEGVPAGDYTRKVLDKLGAGDLVGKAASQEDDARAVTGKVALGEADAGFAYATDAKAVAAEVETVVIPADAQTPIRYAVAVVATSPRKNRAAAFIAKLGSPEGRQALQDAGFGVP